MPAGQRPAPPDDTVRVVFNGTYASLPWAIVMWLQITASTRAVADLNAVLTTISSAYNTNFVPRQNTSAILTNIQGIWKTPGGGEIVGSNGTTRTGSNGGTAASSVAIAIVVNWHIDQYYRGGKPRSYFPGAFASGITNLQTVSATEQTNWASAASAFLTAVNGAASGGITAVKLGTVSFQRSNEWRSPPVFYPYNSASIRSTLGTQRRRLLA